MSKYKSGNFLIFIFCYLISILFVIHKVEAVSKVAGTTGCYQADSGEVLKDDILSIGNFPLPWCVAEVPSANQNNYSGLLCLQTFRCLNDNGFYQSTEKVWFRINASRNDWQYDQQYDTGFRSYELCMGNQYKFYSNITNDYYNNIDDCKNAEILFAGQNTIKFSDTSLNGVCYKLDNVDGVRPIATEGGSISGVFNERCQCTTKKTDLYAEGWTHKGIYYVDDFGNKTSYTSIELKPGSTVNSMNPSDVAEYLAAASSCQQQHPVQFFNSKVGGCYENITDCQRANCNKDTDYGKYQFGGQFYDTLNKAIDAACGAAASIECRTSKNTTSKIKRCDCSTAYNINYTPILCASGQPAGSNCDVACKLIPVKAAGIELINPKSPLAIINVIVNLLFWFAVMLLILNFITAGIEMVQSGNEPQKMKEATERIQSTIFGFIFVLVVSGVINYLINLLNIIIK